MVDRPLIVFDSGIGGFSILKPLLNYLVSIIYFADQANFPYGKHDAEWIQNRFAELADTFQAYNPRGVVIACNTGTVTAIKMLRDRLECPVYGVEPVVKMLAHHTSPVVWGTATTLSSEQAALLKSHHAPHVRYYTPAGLPTAIEHDDYKAIRTILAEALISCPDVDAIGLSCTHYPLIKDSIKKVFPGVTLYDPSHAVARHVAAHQKLISAPYDLSRVTFVSTQSVIRLKSLAHKYL